MYRITELHEQVHKDGEVAFTIAFWLPETQSNTAPDALWLKYSNRAYAISFWRDPMPTPCSQVVFHQYPLQATHALIEVYRNVDKFKRVADMIVRISDYYGDYTFAFVPLSNLYLLQTMEQTDYNTYRVLWASVDMNALCSAVDSHDTKEAKL